MMSGQGRSNAYGGPLPFSYLAGKDNPTSSTAVGLRKEGVYDSAGNVYSHRQTHAPVSRPDTTGRDSGLGRSNHGTGERGYYPNDGDPETGIGYTKHAQDDLDFPGAKNAHMGSTMDNFILKKGPNDLGEGGAGGPGRAPPREEPGRDRTPSPVATGAAHPHKGQPIAADFYNPPPRTTDVDTEVVDDLEKIPKHRPTIFSMIQESEKQDQETGGGFSAGGIGGYSPYQVKDNQTRPSTSSDEFNTMIRTDSYFDTYKEKKQCSLCCAVIVAIVTAIICIGIGFVVGWFVYPMVNGPSTPEATTVANAAATVPGAGAGSTATTTATTTTLSTTSTTTTTSPTPAPTPAPAPTTPAPPETTAST